jgi:hypothetical protein
MPAMACVADARKRRDTDDRFTGAADASGFAPAVDEVATPARRPGWVAPRAVTSWARRLGSWPDRARRSRRIG